MSDWSTYYKTHAIRKPREQTIKAVALCTQKDHALDLGAGTLVESLFLLENSFKKVTAVDSSAETRVFAEGIDTERFTLKISTYQDFDLLPNIYDLANAQFALPFHGPDNFEDFFQRIKVSLKIGGIFAGQLFGVNDDWNIQGRQLAFQTRDEALKLLSNLEILEFREEENKGQTAEGKAKHWHIFHFIARK